MDLKITTLFSKDTGRAGNYRIPSVVVTKQGTVVAACDERFYTCGDNPNRIDKVVRRSEDGGKTWGEQIVAAQEHGASKEFSSAAVDPCMLYDEDADTIFMIYCHTPAGVGILNNKRSRGENVNGNKLVKCGAKKYFLRRGELVDRYENVLEGVSVDEEGEVFKHGERQCNIYTYDGTFKEAATSYLYLIKSFDDGKTWTVPRSLNYQIKERYMAFIGAAPGCGLKIKNGPHKGRLVFPIYFTVSTWPLTESCAAIYSDDGGATWHRGKSPNDCRKRGPLPMNHRFILPGERVSESQIIECENGVLKVFMRNHSSKRRIATAISRDGGESWENFEFNDALPQCICQCSVINADDNGKVATLFLNAADERVRQNGTLRLSYDYGETFVASRLLKAGGFVYSAMAQLPGGEIGVLYEGSTAHETIEFVKLPINWIEEATYAKS